MITKNLLAGNHANSYFFKATFFLVLFIIEKSILFRNLIVFIRWDTVFQTISAQNLSGPFELAVGSNILPKYRNSNGFLKEQLLALQIFLLEKALFPTDSFLNVLTIVLMIGFSISGVLSSISRPESCQCR